MHEKQCHKVVENNPGVSDHGLSITLYTVSHMVQMNVLGDECVCVGAKNLKKAQFWTLECAGIFF
eukprot:2616-Heterococcus_DN1.PRE.2